MSPEARRLMEMAAMVPGLAHAPEQTAQQRAQARVNARNGVPAGNTPDDMARAQGFPDYATMVAFMQRKQEAQNGRPAQAAPAPAAPARGGVFGRLTQAMGG